jgi:AraC-like DNA-binding protein
MNGLKIIRKVTNNPRLKLWVSSFDSAETPQDRILIIDDNPETHRDFRLALASDPCKTESQAGEELVFQKPEKVLLPKPGYRLEHAMSGGEAVEVVKTSVAAGDPFQLAFMGIGITGIECAGIVESLWEIDSSIQIVIVTDHVDRSWQNLSERLGHTDKLLLLRKPFEKVEVILIASTLTEKWFLGRQALDQTEFQSEESQPPDFPQPSADPCGDDIVAMPFRACLSCERVGLPLQVLRKFSHRCLEGAAQRPRGFNQADARFLRRTIEIVEKHMSDCEFDVEALSRMLFISRRQLLRKVMALAGCAPNVLIRKLRLKRAAELLKYSGFTVSEITYAVGFSDLKHFRQVFREQYGMSPGHYARKREDVRE